MRMDFTIPVGDKRYTYSVLPKGRTKQVIVHKDIIVLEIIKRHDHCYELAGFIYENYKIIYPESFKTKKELYGAIQKLLQEKL